MKKLWRDIRGAKKLLCALLVLTFILSVMFSTFKIFPVKAQGAGWADIYVEPPVKYLTKPPYGVGDTFTVEVRIKNYTKVAGYQVKLVYDNSLLNVTSANDVVYDPDDHIFPSGTYSPIAASVADFNGTHQYIMKTATTFGAIEYSGTDAGLVEITFHIVSVPPVGSTYSCVLWVEPKDGGGLYPGDTYSYSMDTTMEDNAGTLTDGFYEIESTVASHVELSPSSIILPEISGDKIVGTDKAKFSVDILIKNISLSDDIIIVQWEINYDGTILNCTDVIEGTFMNDTTWAPYGTQLGWAIDPGRVSAFILINPNSTPPNAGEWNWLERPEGEGLLATVMFEVMYQPLAPESVSFQIDIGGVFGEFFLNTDIDYVPYGPPLNATFTLNGYNCREPVAAFTYTPDPVEVNKTATFDASVSYGWRNVDGTLVQDSTYIKEYIWDWGDDTTDTTTTSVITHTYSDFGTYTVNLTVVDYDNLINWTTKSFVTVEVVSHTVTYDAQSFTVVTVSTGKIQKDSIVLIQNHRCLYFNITGESGTLGIVNITIPTELLSATPQDWMVILQMGIITTQNGLIVTPVDADHTRLTITFTFSSKEPIFIFGTHVIPEFSGNTLALVFMAISIVAMTSLAISKKRKK